MSEFDSVRQMIHYINRGIGAGWLRGEDLRHANDVAARELRDRIDAIIGTRT
jgi:hypothetical protein